MTSTRELVRTERYLTPFEEIEQWFEDAWLRPSSLFGASLWPAARLMELNELSPSVDIYEEGNELILKADLPGLGKDEVTVDVSNNTLNITGEKKREEKVDKENYYRYERAHGCFNRSFELPEGLDTEKVKAHFKDGVLEIRIPKTDAAIEKTHKIPIE